MNANVNAVKLFAPELIPEPLRLNGRELEEYTKKIYDYLRRLQSAFAFILNQLTVDIETVQVTSPFTSILVHVTGDDTGVLLSAEDWRGKTVWYSVKEQAETGVTDDVWGGGDSAPLAFEFGSGYDGTGIPPIDFPLHTVAGSGGTVALFLQTGTGHIIADFSGYSANYYIRLVLIAAPTTSTVSV